MRILITIPHYFRSLGGRNGAVRDPLAARLRAFRSCLAALRQEFSRPHAALHHARRKLIRADQSPRYTLDILVCTTGPHHLVHRTDFPVDFSTHCATNAAPPLLGFECHDLLRERLGAYDYYCYMEDDLVVRDPLFFVKLAWFRDLFGDDCLLQPHRFEACPTHPVRKLFIDGDMARRATARFQDIADAPELRAETLGVPVVFRRPLNPHAGCFFLSGEQMAVWSRHPSFGRREASFIGPLESAATLGVMRTFRIYKTAWPDASFFEIQHCGNAYARLLRTRSLPSLAGINVFRAQEK